MFISKRSATMEQFLEKKYALVSSGNEVFEEYLTFMGFGFLHRKTALALKPVQQLILNKDGTYSFKSETKLMNWSITFTPGVEFIQSRADGVKQKALATIEGNKMILVQTEDCGRVSTHVHEFFPHEMVLTTTVVGFDKTLVRRYELVK